MLKTIMKNTHLLRYILYYFLANFIFDSQLQFVLINEYKNIDFLKIGVLEVVLLVTVIIFELPSGIIADSFGKKRTLIVSRILVCLYSLIILLCNSYPFILLAFLFFGMMDALTSGTEEGYLYELNEVVTCKKVDYISLNSVTYILAKLGGAIAVFLGGLFSQFNWKIVYIMTIIFQLISMFFLIDKNNTPPTDYVAEGKTIKQQLTDTFSKLNVLLHHCEYQLVGVSTILFDAVYSIYLIFYPSILSINNVSKFNISIVLVLSIIVGISFVFVVNRLKWNNHSRRVVIGSRAIVTLLMLATIIFRNSAILYSTCIIIAASMTTIYFPANATVINSIIPGEIRVSANSIINLVQTILMCLLSPLAGYFLNINCIPVFLIILITIASISLIFILIPVHHK